jgi:hypothetical protein
VAGTLRPLAQRAGLALFGASLALSVLWVTDLAVATGRFRAGSPFDWAFFHEYQRYLEEEGSRTARPEGQSSLVAGGLRAHAVVTLRLEVRARQGPYGVRLTANGTTFERTLGRERQVWEVRAESNRRGDVVVRFEPVDRDNILVAVSQVEARHETRGAVPPLRLWVYLFGGLAGGALLGRTRVPVRHGLVAITATAALCAGLLAAARCQTLAVLPWVVAVAALVEGWLLLAEAVAALPGVPLGHARWIAAATLVRMVLFLHPDFHGADLEAHVNRMLSFRDGQLITSGAPGIEVTPYPPGFHALVAPFSARDRPTNVVLVRLAMGLLESVSPLLLIPILRASGAPPLASSAAAVTLAVLPQGVLTLAMAIGPNILGSAATLLLVAALLRRASTVVVAALLCLVFLSHAAVAATVAGFLGLWWLVAWRAGDEDRTFVPRWIGAVVVAAIVAWLAYYREVPLVFGPALGKESADGGLFDVRWQRVGKLAQDLLLKFGLFPLLVAAYGWPEARGLPRLRHLLVAWLVTGAGLGVVALASPFPLRFEYFLGPAVAMAAGLGAARLAAEGRGALVTASWAFALAVQAALGLLHLFGRFQLASVIMESRRWPFPVRF